MSNDHQAALLAYIADHPIIERRSDLTAIGIPPDLIGGLLDGLVACGELVIDGTKYIPGPGLPDIAYSAEDAAVADVLLTVRGASGKKDWAQVLEMVAKLRADFPLVNLLEQVEHWAAYKLDHPLTAKSNVASQLHTWMKKSLEYKADATARPVPFGGDKSDKRSSDPDKYVKGKYGHMVDRGY